MRKNDPSNIHCIYVGLKLEEYAKIELQYKASTCRNKSEYIRNLIYNRPITILYRNQSLDNLIEEMVILNNEINAIKNDLSKTLEILHIHKDSLEFKKSLQDVELSMGSLYKKIDEVKNQIEKITDKWLQS
jgi:hypothetical protein